MKKQKNKRRKHRNMEYLSRRPVLNDALRMKKAVYIRCDRPSICRPGNQNARGR